MTLECNCSICGHPVDLELPDDTANYMQDAYVRNVNCKECHDRRVSNKPEDLASEWHRIYREMEKAKARGDSFSAEKFEDEIARIETKLNRQGIDPRDYT